MHSAWLYCITYFDLDPDPDLFWIKQKSVFLNHIDKKILIKRCIWKNKSKVQYLWWYSKPFVAFLLSSTHDIVSFFLVAEVDLSMEETLHPYVVFVCY
jgi:hypothetical protein